MRIDRMDKLDRINFYQNMHSNLVKWWTFNMVDPDELLEENVLFAIRDYTHEVGQEVENEFGKFVNINKLYN